MGLDAEGVDGTRAPGLGCMAASEARAAGTWRASKGTGQAAFSAGIAARGAGRFAALSRRGDGRARGGIVCVRGRRRVSAGVVGEEEQGREM